jgi:hypothetical protein
MVSWYGHLIYLSSGLGAFFYVNNQNLHKAPVVHHKLEGEKSERLEQDVEHEIERRHAAMEARMKELQEMEVTVQELQRTGDVANAAKHEELLRMEAKLKQMEANEAKLRQMDDAAKAGTKVTQMGACPDAGVGDVFSALWSASSRSTTLIKQAFSFVGETIAAKIWPWPVDSLVKIPDVGAILSSKVQELIEKPQMKPLREALSGFSEKAGVVVAPGLAAFRHRYPEQYNFDGGREPGLVLLSFCILLVVAAWQLYGIWFFVRRVVCCRCRKRSSGDTPNVEVKERAASGVSSASDTEASTPRSGKKAKRSNGKK